MIDKQKLDKIRQNKRNEEIKQVGHAKQMEIDALNEQLGKLQKNLEKKDKELKAKDSELKKLKKSNTEK